MELPDLDLTALLIAGALVLGSALLVSLLLLGLVIWRVRKIQLPPGADFFTALRATPLIVVLLLDLLDFALDFLSAPLAWVLLTRLGLGPLRGVTLVESLLPGTQVIPTMTLAWIGARLFESRQSRSHRIP